MVLCFIKLLGYKFFVDSYEGQGVIMTLGLLVIAQEEDGRLDWLSKKGRETYTNAQRG